MAKAIFISMSAIEATIGIILIVNGAIHTDSTALIIGFILIANAKLDLLLARDN